MDAEKKVPLPEKEKHMLLERLIPKPVNISFFEGAPCDLVPGCRVEVRTPDRKEAEATLSALFREWWVAVPEFMFEETPDTAGKGRDGSYSVSADARGLKLRADGRAGILNAMRTLRQLAEPLPCTAKLEHRQIVPCEIDDFPAFGFRGFHLHITPETPIWNLEKHLRLAAYEKFNYCFLSMGGTFPFESHPELCWAGRTFGRDELNRIVDLAGELGVGLVPCFNILSVATNARPGAGKHVVLDPHPELAPLMEPGGWTWCISNPHTRKFLSEITLELLDFFRSPKLFHIGCSEAYMLGTCPACRKKKVKDALLEHLIFFRNLLAEHGARAVMWHDMLLEKADPRWHGCVANALPEHGIAELCRELPRDIVIADWEYNAANDTDGTPNKWPSAKFFKSLGFDTLVCPWKEESGTVALARLALENKLDGMIQTTWCGCECRNEFQSVHGTGACAAWNPAADAFGYKPHRELACVMRLRDVVHDMKLREYEQYGICRFQTSGAHHTHAEI